MTTRLRSLLAAGCALTPTLAADTLTVGPPGSGADFETIQEAVDAAAAGDTVSVLPGDYAPFRSSKPIQVQGAGAERTRIVAPAFVADPAGISISGIAAGDVATVSGITVDDGVGPLLLAGALVDLRANAGTVVLHDVLIFSDNGYAALALNKCFQVVLSELDFHAGGTVFDYVIDSRVSHTWMNGVALEVQPKPFPVGINCRGLGLFQSTARLARSEILGDDVLPTMIINGGNAVEMTESTLELVRSRLGGGDGTDFAGGYGATLAAGSVVTAYRDSSVEGGFNGTGTVQQSPVQLGNHCQFLSVDALKPALGCTVQTAPGGTVELTLTGAPGAEGGLFASLGLDVGRTVPGVDGELFLDLETIVPLATVRLPAGGEALVEVDVPPQAGLSGQHAAFQWFDGDAASLSNPAVLSIR